jgi:hypothetical protein
MRWIRLIATLLAVVVIVGAAIAQPPDGPDGEEGVGDAVDVVGEGWVVLGLADPALA